MCSLFFIKNTFIKTADIIYDSLILSNNTIAASNITRIMPTGITFEIRPHIKCGQYEYSSLKIKPDFQISVQISISSSSFIICFPFHKKQQKSKML